MSNLLKSVRFQNLPSVGTGIKSYLTLKNIGIFSFAVVLVIIAYYIYQSATSKKTTEANSNNNNNTSNGKDAEIIMFYTDWCPHCKTAKPEWEQVKAEYEGKQINGYTLVFTEVNCTNESPDVEKMMNTYKVEGFPTIKLIKDNQVIDYDAKPSKATLIQFLNTVV